MRWLTRWSHRSLHYQLNKFITTRVRLALPPCAFTPDAYAAGFAAFAQIYLAFEEVWDEVTKDVDLEASWIDIVPYAQQLAAKQSGDPKTQLIRFLRTLRPDGLARSERARQDLCTLLAVPPSQLDATLDSLPGSTIKQWKRHITQQARSRPHILIAYGWVLYMAIFSGGRWIRGELVGVGEDFWSANQPPKVELQEQEGMLENFETLGLSFWFHPGQRDGEDINKEFRLRLRDGDHILTASQRKDIVKEGSQIFDWCSALVEELDCLVGGVAKPSIEKKAQVIGYATRARTYGTWLPLLFASAVGMGWLSTIAAGRFSVDVVDLKV